MGYIETEEANFLIHCGWSSTGFVDVVSTRENILHNLAVMFADPETRKCRVTVRDSDKFYNTSAPQEDSLLLDVRVDVNGTISGNIRFTPEDMDDLVPGFTALIARSNNEVVA